MLVQHPVGLVPLQQLVDILLSQPIGNAFNVLRAGVGLEILDVIHLPAELLLN